jgi:hypothetical protein
MAPGGRGRRAIVSFSRLWIHTARASAAGDRLSCHWDCHPRKVGPVVFVPALSCVGRRSTRATERRRPGAVDALPSSNEELVPMLRLVTDGGVTAEGMVASRTCGGQRRPHHTLTVCSPVRTVRRVGEMLQLAGGSRRLSG